MAECRQSQPDGNLVLAAEDNSAKTIQYRQRIRRVATTLFWEAAGGSEGHTEKTHAPDAPAAGVPIVSLIPARPAITAPNRRVSGGNVRDLRLREERVEFGEL